MKIFQTIQRNYAILGISPEQLTHPKFLFNGKMLMCFLFSIFYMLSSFAYIFYVATTFEQYIECITTAFGGIIISICIGAVVFKMNKLFEIIKNVEDFTAMRK